MSETETVVEAAQVNGEKMVPFMLEGAPGNRWDIRVSPWVANSARSFEWTAVERRDEAYELHLHIVTRDYPDSKGCSLEWLAREVLKENGKDPEGYRKAITKVPRYAADDAAADETKRLREQMSAPGEDITDSLEFRVVGDQYF